MGIYAKPQDDFSVELTQPLGITDGVAYLSENVTEDFGWLTIGCNTDHKETCKYTSKFSGGISGLERNLSTTGAASTAGTGYSHSTGETVEMRVVHNYWSRIVDAMNGVSSTSSNEFILGDGTGAVSAQGNILFSFQTSAGKMFRVGLSSSGYGVWTEDNGVTYNRLSATGGVVNTGDGWQNIGGTGSVVVADLISATAGISSKNDNFTINEAFSPTWIGDHGFTGTNLNLSATNVKLMNTKLSCQPEELNRISGLSAYTAISPYEVNKLLGGGQVSTGNSHYHFFVTSGTSRPNVAGVQDLTFSPAFNPRILNLQFNSWGGIAASSYLIYGNGYATSATTFGYWGHIITWNGALVTLGGINSLDYIMRNTDSGGNLALATVSVMSAGRVTINWVSSSSAGSTYFTYQIYG
jgi:hypothetical protein